MASWNIFDGWNTFPAQRLHVVKLASLVRTSEPCLFDFVQGWADVITDCV